MNIKFRGDPKFIVYYSLEIREKRNIFNSLWYFNSKIKLLMWTLK